MEEKTIIALEVGSSKIKGAAGIVDPNGSLTVKAVEEEAISDIVRYGCVRNVVETATAVRSVIDRLQSRLAPRRIEGVYLSVGGRSLASSVHTVERRLGQETEVTRQLIDSIIDEALRSSIPDRTVIDVIPRELIVDGTVDSKPIGTMASTVEARLNLITCRTQLMRNLLMVIEERLGLKVMDTFVRPLAEADLVLLPEEKRLGCMMVDFGAETTTVAIYRGGVLVHLATLPMGSRNITRDITALNHLEERAEDLKIQGGCALSGFDSSAIPVAGVDFTAVNNYVSARSSEIILNIIEQVKQAGLTADRLPAGIVIVGRGARLNGFNQRLEEMSRMKVRIGAPGNRVRILDSRSHGSDAVDVIAILAEAARNNPVDCLSKPEPKPAPEPAPQPVPEPAPAPQPRPATVVTPPRPVNPNPAPAPAPKRGDGFWGKIVKKGRERLTSFMTEDDGYEDE